MSTQQIIESWENGIEPYNATTKTSWAIALIRLFNADAVERFLRNPREISETELEMIQDELTVMQRDQFPTS